MLETMLTRAKPVLAMLLLLGLAGQLFGYDAVIINSADGRDVLSGVFYANAVGIPAYFLTSGGGGLDTLIAKVGENRSVFLIQSRDAPLSAFLQAELLQGGNTLYTYTSTDGGLPNLDMARKSGASTFVVVDTAYSDGALSALPFAARQRA